MMSPKFLLLFLVCLTSVSGFTARRGMNTQAQHEGRGMELSAKARSSLDEVVQLLMTMLKDFDNMMAEDHKNWEDFSKWSDDTEVAKRDFQAKTEAFEMQQRALQASNENEIQTLTADLAALAQSIAETKASIVELVNLRQEEHAAHQAEMEDITKTLVAVGKAIQVMEGFYAGEKAALPEIARRVQMALTMTSSISTASINQVTTALLQQGSRQQNTNPDFLNTDGSKYDNYEKQGGQQVVMKMLEDLRVQLEQQRQSSIEKEGEAQRQFEATKAAKETDLAGMETLQEEKTLKKQECEATVEQCIANIKQAVIDIANAKEFLTNLLAERAQFQKEFDERVAMRRNEQAATQAALDALQTVSAGNTAGFIQKRALSFVQTRSRRNSAKLQATVAHMLKLGQSMHSDSLIQAATALKVPTENFDNFMGDTQQSFYDASGFGPVIKLLRDLITRLEEEAAAETSQHEWCENEKTSGVETQQAREKSIKMLTAEVDTLTTDCATLKSEVEFLESELVRIARETQEAKELRAEQQKAYEIAKADHEEVIKAINAALEALSGQYGFIQIREQHKRRGPQDTGVGTPFGEYQSGGEGGASAMEMLQDLNTRYSTALEEIIATEIAQKKAHEELLIRNEQFRIDTTNTKNAKTAERRAKINRLNDAKAELKTNMVELHEVSKYLQDLRPSCDDIRSTFEERKKRREAEISALKEALEVISDPSMMAGF